MDNYKIKVKDEAESKEAQELLFKLGYVWADTKCQTPMKFTTSCIYSGFEDGELCCDYYDENPNHQELTLPQLRDLVVLKRNDINDANWETEGGDQIFKDSNNKSYIYRTDGWDELQRHEMRQAMWEKPKAIAKPQDPALISGREAWLAFFDGLHVQWSGSDREAWFNFKEEDWNTQSLKNDGFIFRLKPQTIKVELELPKPFVPKDGDDCFIVDSEQEDGFYRFTYSENSGFHQNFIQFGAYKTEDDVKKAVEQLRKIRGAS
ncbi:hypothetical protein [Acinetobacter sp. ABJ_C5_2]|uniref:hypothetical protein n=1 Tax=Acinetobacter sp. ABJ_C5_2 TaxID=3376992 RepID=UPI0037CB876F